MSAEALAIVLNHSRAKGTAKVVLIGIANHDGDGGAWPSVATLARYANVDARNVQRAIDSLEALGEVRRIKNAGGTHLTADAHRPNLYRIMLRCPSTCDRSAQHRMGQFAAAPSPIVDLAEYGVANSPGGGGSATPGVAAAPRGGVAPAPPEPPIELTTHLSETNLSNRARANDAERCTIGKRRGRPHRFAESGYCLDCGARRPEDVSTADPRTGEIA